MSSSRRPNSVAELLVCLDVSDRYPTREDAHALVLQHVTTTLAPAATALRAGIQAARTSGAAVTVARAEVEKLEAALDAAFRRFARTAVDDAGHARSDFVASATGGILPGVVPTLGRVRKIAALRSLVEQAAVRADLASSPTALAALGQALDAFEPRSRSLDEQERKVGEDAATLRTCVTAFQKAWSLFVRLVDSAHGGSSSVLPVFSHPLKTAKVQPAPAREAA